MASKPEMERMRAHMVVRQSPRNLPGTDAWRLWKGLIGLYLVVAVVILGLSMLTAILNGTDRGHLPWPVAQWAVTTPLGALAVAVVGGLVWGLPASLIVLTRPVVVRPVDVTDIPPYFWPRPLSLWADPTGGALADSILGRGRPQRALSVLTLAVAALLLIGLIALFFAVIVYGIRNFPTCGESGCAPTFTFEFTSLPEVVGLTIMFLSQYAWTTHVERRCGIWFRARGQWESNLGAYIRRPGVAPEAAAAALQRYARNASIPMAGAILLSTLAVIPPILLMSGGALLAFWLSSQWIPT